MRGLLRRCWHEDEGLLTFEWVLLITILVIGIVGGLSAARDGMISELDDVTTAAVSLDQSYIVEVIDYDGDPDNGVIVDFGYESFSFQDSLPNSIENDCATGRATDSPQTAVSCP